MTLMKPIAAMTAGCLIVMSAVALAQSGGGERTQETPAVQVLVVPELAHLNWIEKSSVAALSEGVVEKMELQPGMVVKKGGTIGVLHKELAELTVKKNMVQAASRGPLKKAEAQKDVAISVCARNTRLNDRLPGTVSAEDVAKNEGELKVAVASIQEAKENIAIAEAELKLAERALEERTIVAPFDGEVIRRMKHPGEMVRAGDAVVELGNYAKLAADAYVPLEFAFRVREGQVVEVQLRLNDARAPQPLDIEKKRFRGKITFVDPEIQPVAESAVHIRAEFDNANFELKPGFKVQMTIFLTNGVAAGSSPGADSTRTARAR
jgi:RND family efflux transporter MFP subunit